MAICTHGVFGSAGLSRSCFPYGFFNEKNTEVHVHKSLRRNLTILTSHPVHRVVSHKVVEVTCAFSLGFKEFSKKRGAHFHMSLLVLKFAWRTRMEQETMSFSQVLVLFFLLRATRTDTGQEDPDAQYVASSGQKSARLSRTMLTHATKKLVNSCTHTSLHTHGMMHAALKSFSFVSQTWYRNASLTRTQRSQGCRAPDDSVSGCEKPMFSQAG